MADEPDWTKVLHTLHQAQVGELSTKDDLRQFLMEETDLGEVKVKEALEYLNAVGLVKKIEIAGHDETRAPLTPEGFNVAHERELAKRQDRTNTTLVGFTLALVLASLVAVLPSAWPFLGYELNLRLVGAFVLLAVVVGFIWYTDLHEDLLDL